MFEGTGVLSTQIHDLLEVVPPAINNTIEFLAFLTHLGQTVAQHGVGGYPAYHVVAMIDTLFDERHF